MCLSPSAQSAFCTLHHVRCSALLFKRYIMRRMVSPEFLRLTTWSANSRKSALYWMMLSPIAITDPVSGIVTCYSWTGLPPHWLPGPTAGLPKAFRSHPRTKLGFDKRADIQHIIIVFLVLRPTGLGSIISSCSAFAAFAFAIISSLIVMVFPFVKTLLISPAKWQKRR